MAIPPFPPQFDLQVQHAKVEGQLHVIESENVHGQLNVAGVTHLENTVRIDGALTVGNDADFAGRMTTTEVRLAFSGVDAALWPLLRASGANQAELGGALRVTGVTNLGNDVQVAGNLTVTGILDAAAIHQNGQPFVGSNWDKVAGGINYSGGKVGIGVVSPTQALEVNGAIKATDFIKGAAPLVSSQWADVAGGINYADGKVGIGMATPNEMLDVAGNVRLNDNNLWLRRGADPNHGMGWYGVGKLFANTNLDGPALFGCSGGALGTACGGQKIALYWNNGGRVGIGTTSPSQTLDVRGYNLLTDPNAQYNSHFPFSNNSAYVTGENIYLRGGAPQGWRAALAITNSNGNVGIGTTGPTHRFHVVAQDAVGLFESTGTQAYLRLSTQEGLNNRVEITNRPGGRLSLWVAGAGDVFNITRGGNVGIGTLNPQQKLHVGGDYIRVDGRGNEQVYIGGDGAGGDVQLGSFNANVKNVAVWNTATSTRMNLYVNDLLHTGRVTPISDARLKTNVRPLTNALATLAQIRGVSFEWNHLYHALGATGQRQEIGLLAQEVEAVLPELVSDWGNQGYKGVDYSRLTVVLLEAIKELRIELQQLKATMV